MEENTRKLYEYKVPYAYLVSNHIQRAVGFAKREWWAKAERELEAAYAIAGAKNPASGFDFYRGTHPLFDLDPWGNHLYEIM